ncbi:transposase [Cyanobacterium sp. Dongsha4]|nr:transposase [Cyanobacterium sp. Dongsha4]
MLCSSDLRVIIVAFAENGGGIKKVSKVVQFS